MEWPEVLKRIDAGEDRTTEFKRGFEKDRPAVGKALCAFANGEGGLIVLGVEDSGAIVGLKEDPHKTHERLTNFLQNGCSQPISARCGRSGLADGWVHWIEVPRIRGYEPFRYGGRCYIRRERSSVEPSPSELQELNNAFGFIVTEEQVILGAGVRDIDVQAFRSFQRAQGFDTEDEEQPSIEDDLRNAGIIDLFDGALRPTLYGLMVFGEAPQAHRRTGNFLIRCAAYAGEDQGADVFLAAEGDGRLDRQVQQALDWIKIFGRTETYTGVLREDRPLIPEPAIREALVNAVVHRDYAITGSPVLLEVFDDRISVTSPGALPNHLSVDAFRAGGRPRARNQVMTHAMTVMGVMERRGRGWRTMRRAMLAFNGTEPEPVDDRDGRVFSITFRRRGHAEDN